jgi:hypothetical protein
MRLSIIQPYKGRKLSQCYNVDDPQRQDIMLNEIGQSQEKQMKDFIYTKYLEFIVT